ncbi:hypothetical protein HD554DRAFT_2016911 [Boletus coccyginus]|nr:hypothetical protein HD554DRAFT_2016911 [Boletus coccyginus]
MFGVGMGAGPALKGLNSGWQARRILTVWGTTTPSSKRNASISSAASVNDLSPSQGENAYRSNIGESWTAPRPSSGTWDELSGSPQKKEFPQLVSQSMDANSPLSLHHARQRQATVVQVATLSGTRIDDRSSAKPGQFSPQMFDNGLGKDAPVSSRYPSPSNPTYGSSSFSGHNGTFDVSMVENELSLGLRGMVVEDDHINNQYRQPSIALQQPNGIPHHTSPQARPSPMVQGRTPYIGYPRADYSSYYTNGAPRDPYMDYGYGYTTPADHSLYPAAGGMNSNSSANVYPGVSPQTLHPNASGQQSGIYYDYSASARSPSQYFYPTHQPMIYPTIPSISPMPTPQLTAAVPTGIQDKKQVCICFGFVDHACLFGVSMDFSNR